MTMAGPSLPEALSEAGKIQTEGAQSQQRIDSLREATERLNREFREQNQQLQDLSINYLQLREVQQTQQQQIDSLNEQLAQVAQTEQGLTPMLLTMVDWLEQFIATDLPFHVNERRQRIDTLKRTMLASGGSLTEQYRRVMEAYQIESEFGYTMEHYSGEIEREGQRQQVDMLRVGRVGLYFASLDGSQGGYWSREANSWKSADPSTVQEIARGLLMADKQRPQALLTLPVSARQ